MKTEEEIKQRIDVFKFNLNTMMQLGNDRNLSIGEEIDIEIQKDRIELLEWVLEH